MTFVFLVFVFLNGEFPISTATGRQWHPAVACDGERYLVIWEDTRKTGDIFNNDIWGQFVSKEGTLIDTNFPICTADSGQWEIDVAWGDSNYLVVWCDHRDKPSFDIWGQLVSSEGILIDTPFVISNTNNHKTVPAVVWGNTHYLSIWMEHYNTDSCKIRGQFVLPSGGLEGIPFSIVPEGWNQFPAVAFDGINYLVVWNKYWGKSYFDIYGQLVDSVGILIDTAFLILQGANGAMYSDVAFGGTNYLVVSDGWNSNDSILGQLVAPDGSLVGSPIPIAVEPESIPRGRPKIAWNGVNYLVVWDDLRNGSDGDVYGQWISLSGNLLDTNFAVIEHPAPQDPPVIASDGTDFLVAWCDGRGADAFDIYGRIVSGTGVEEITKSKVQSVKLEVYPNPFVGLTEVKTQLSEVRIYIYDVSGKLVEEADRNVIGQNLPAGVYFVKSKGYEPVKIIKMRGVKL